MDIDSPPMVCLRKQRASKLAPIVEKDNVEIAKDDNVGVVEEDFSVPSPDDVHVPPHFPGGPYDLSVLRSFQNHVALRLWHGEDRSPLNVAAHRLKLRKLVNSKPSMPPEIEKFVQASSLCSLLYCSFPIVNNALISVFAERWHRDTSSFHLPIGEMTITLDDVSCLLHLPCRGTFFTFPNQNRDTAIAIVMQLLSVSYHIASLEYSQNRGPYLRLSWLRELYKEKCADQEWEPAARAFLLHLVGCTIFANKSQSLIDIKFIEMFRDLSNCGNWSWGASALAVLYENLNDASMHQTKQIGGYMTLIQAWIYEYFPTICEPIERQGYKEHKCRALRWKSVKGDGKVKPVRRKLDDLACLDVTWNPYKAHRNIRGFDPVSLFSGYIRIGTIMTPYLPERVVRQFGHVQRIPRSPQLVTGLAEIDERWSDFSAYFIDISVRGPLDSDETGHNDGYLKWYARISHRFIIPPDVVPAPSSAEKDHLQLMSRCGRRDALELLSFCRLYLTENLLLKVVTFHTFNLALSILEGKSDEGGNDYKVSAKRRKKTRLRR